VGLPVVQGEGQEPALHVVPLVLMPGDVFRGQKLCPAQKRVAPPEVYQLAADHRT